MSKIMPWCILLLTLCLRSALAQDQGHGRVTLNGQIVASACTIDGEDVNQSVYLGALPLRRLIKDGQGPIRKFNLHLINCIVRNTSKEEQWRDVLITFDGVTDESLLFAIQGISEGIGIRIMDSHQRIAEAGKPMDAADIEINNNTLSYQLQLVRNKKKLRSGDLYSIIRFLVYYQ